MLIYCHQPVLLAALKFRHLFSISATLRSNDRRVFDTATIKPTLLFIFHFLKAATNFLKAYLLASRRLVNHFIRLFCIYLQYLGEIFMKFVSLYVTLLFYSA